MDEPKALNWLSEELQNSLASVLSQQWILDVDCTVKPIYGHQEGASIGYNPHKPGRPSHTYHSYFMANTRLCLGVEVHDGKQNAGKYGMPGLWAILDKFPRTHWPIFVRGDCGYGNEIILSEAEERGLPYLFKRRQTKLVQKLIVKMLQRTSQWVDAGDGWEVIEAQLQLSGCHESAGSCWYVKRLPLRRCPKMAVERKMFSLRVLRAASYGARLPLHGLEK